MPEPKLPVDTLGEALPFFRRPYTVEAIKWKIQSDNAKNAAGGTKGWALCVPYIDARLVEERLNLVVSAQWHDEYMWDAGGSILWCALTVCGVTRRDVGTGQGRESHKSAVSDALKRAAVKFGIGVSLYAIPKMGLFEEHLKKKGTGDKARFELTDGGFAEVTKRYREWLESHGIEHFGEPLDHGDILGSLGDPEDPGPGAGAPSAAEVARV